MCAECGTVCKLLQASYQDIYCSFQGRFCMILKNVYVTFLDVACITKKSIRSKKKPHKMGVVLNYSGNTGDLNKDVNTPSKSSMTGSNQNSKKNLKHVLKNCPRKRVRGTRQHTEPKG